MTEREMAQKYPSTIPAMIVANDLGVSFATIKRGIDGGIFPFGVNVGVEGRTNRYIIPTTRYIAWKNGRDINVSKEEKQNA